jgi:UDPglucose 6-dehydrogenase
LSQGAGVRVFDPAVKEIPQRWAGKVTQYATALEAVSGADVLVVGTEWPELRQYAGGLATQAKPALVVIDANRHLQAQLAQTEFKYLAVGTPLSVGGT